MTLRARFLTNMSDLRTPLRDFKSARERKTTTVRRCVHTYGGEQCDLHVMRHSATACDVYQMTEKAYLYRWELSNGVNWNSSVGMKKTHFATQVVVVVVTTPNTKAMKEKAIGVRLWMRLLVKPWILKVRSGYRVSVNKRPNKLTNRYARNMFASRMIHT